LDDSKPCAQLAAKLNVLVVRQTSAYSRRLTASYRSGYRIMIKTRLSSKGQIVLPKAVREHHRWSPGTEFIVEETPEGVLLQPAKKASSVRLDQVIGSLRYTGKAKTLAEMDAAITAEVKARRARGRY
jgi:AbrB family looped-hinge helix DNA binding protein